MSQRRNRGDGTGARSRDGFTLVELLVVIAIIGTLVGVLIPSINMVRRKGAKTACLNNLREIGKLAIMYSDENKDRFPLARNQPAFASLQKLADWARGDVKPEQFVCPSSTDLAGEVDADSSFTLDETSCSYAWISKPTKNNTRSTTALGSDDSIQDEARDITENHARGVNVVYVDGSATWVNQAELQEGLPKGLVDNSGG
ncbi:MAG: type II secretion system protein [Planctomycetota bacterium]